MYRSISSAPSVNPYSANYQPPSSISTTNSVSSQPPSQQPPRQSSASSTDSTPSVTDVSPINPFPTHRPGYRPYFPQQSAT